MQKQKLEIDSPLIFLAIKLARASLPQIGPAFRPSVQKEGAEGSVEAALGAA